MDTNNQEAKPPPIKKEEEDDDDSDDDHSYVSEPDEAEKRYAALRNHQIRFSDAIDPNAERVHEIREIDIVLGRGRGFQNHSGNRRMRIIIENYKTQYHSLSRMDKRKLVQEVYEKVIANGARFLKKLDDEDAWVVVDLPIALQKVSHTMRCRKSIHKQLDAQGHLPPGMSDPTSSVSMRKKIAPISRLPQGMAPPQQLGLGGIPRVVSAGQRDPLVGAPASLAAMAMPSSLAGLPPTGFGALGGFGGFQPTAALPSMTELEVQHLAAQRRYQSIVGMSAESRMDYIEEMRRQQIIRETQMFSRMGDALLNSGGAGLSPLGASTLLPSSMHAAGLQAGMAAPPLTPAEVELANRLSPNIGQFDPRLLGMLPTNINPSVVESTSSD